jgi:hypothetical protein
MAMLNSQRVNHQMVKFGEVLSDFARGFTLNASSENLVPQNPVR